MTPSARFSCRFCDRSFPQKKTLKRHMRAVHQKQAFRCPECPRTFNRADIRERHRAEQHGEKAEPIECMNCGAMVRERTLRGHLETRRCRNARVKSEQSIRRVASHGESHDVDHTISWLRIGDILDPLLLSACLFVQIQPYMKSNWSIDSNRSPSEDSLTGCYTPSLAPSTEILELQGYVMRAIARRLNDRTVDHALVAALWLFTDAYRAINGPEHNKVHEQALSPLLDYSSMYYNSLRGMLRKVFVECRMRDLLVCYVNTVPSAKPHVERRIRMIDRTAVRAAYEKEKVIKSVIFHPHFLSSVRISGGILHS